MNSGLTWNNLNSACSDEKMYLRSKMYSWNKIYPIQPYSERVKSGESDRFLVEDQDKIMLF